jgi:nucleotide-binding universal stress UspA family protein
MEPVYKRILLALDGSSVSSLANTEAVALGRAFKAKLRIVHVIDPYSPDASWWTTPEAQRESHVTNRERAMEKLAETVRMATQSGVEADMALLELNGGQDISERIAEECDGWHADLVVLGTHGRRGLDRFALGSVAEGVARIAKAPALLVRGAAEAL